MNFALIWPQIWIQIWIGKTHLFLQLNQNTTWKFFTTFVVSFSTSNWYPFFVVLFWVLSPIPTLISRRFSTDMSTSSALKEFCIFITTGIVISAFALPILLARAPFENPVVSLSRFRMNRTVHIRDLCKKTAVLSCHRCLINAVLKKWNTFKYRLELWPPDVSK